MGQALSEPVRTKTTESGDTEHYAYATSAMQGWRISMEDSHACVLDMNKSGGMGDSPVDTAGHPGLEQLTAFFGVYDGHGGTSTANFTGQFLHKLLYDIPAFRAGKYRTALRDAFLEADRMIKTDAECAARPSGCTATTALLTESTVYVANAGDSRTILSINGKAKPMSFDHKPTDPGEQSRVEQAGGRVKDGRVNEHLALSRAFGDFDFKNDVENPESQPVSIYPDITTHKLTDDVEFMILACDGIWDCKTSQDVIDYVRKAIADGTELPQICENIMDECLSEDYHSACVGCDNMTITIVALLRGKTIEQWVDGIREKVSKTESVTVSLDKPVVQAPVLVV